MFSATPMDVVWNLLCITIVIFFLSELVKPPGLTTQRVSVAAIAAS